MAAKIQFLAFLCVSALFTSGFADTIDDEEDYVYHETMTNISSMVDAVLPTVRQQILEKGMDPMKLDDVYQPLPGPIVHNRAISLTNGQLQGLSGISRVDDTILISGNNIYTVIATMGFNALEGTYDYLFKDVLIKKQGKINGHLNNVAVKVVADIDLENRRVILRGVNIVRIDEMSVTLGDNTDQHTVKLILKHIKNRFFNTILSVVEKQLLRISQQYLNKLLDKLPLSEEFMASNDIIESIPTLVNSPTDNWVVYTDEEEISTFKFHFHPKICVEV